MGKSDDSATKPPSKKTTALRQLVTRPELSFLMEAHNGLSAAIAQEAGFEGIWASGLSISASLGVRDNNEASWTQVLEVLEFMADATKVPILIDGDTGYGNFNTMRRVVRKLEERGLAGVCIEDKIFPKSNSFVRGTAQPLADIQEFCGKIRAGKEAQRDDDFVIVARVEAFIAGWGLEEALKRGEAYRQAGADAILIHSALRTPTEIFEFKKEWGNRLPLVIVPTKYYTTPTELFRELGFSVVIWANHLMRSALTAMQQTARQIFTEQTLANVEDRVAPLAEVFRLQGESELEAAEKLYLPRNATSTRGIVLAASRGEELGDFTKDRPKCMVEVSGKPLLGHIADVYRASGIQDITVVRGYKKDAVNLTAMTYVDNDDYASTQAVASLSKAMPRLSGDCIISYGDVLCKKYVLQQLMDTEADFVIAVDAEWKSPRNRELRSDFVKCSRANSRKAVMSRVVLADFVSAEDPDIHGEWMGFLKVSAAGANVLRQTLETALKEPGFAAMKMPALIKRIMSAGHEIRVVYMTGHWIDVDGIAELLQGTRFSLPPGPT